MGTLLLLITTFSNAADQAPGGQALRVMSFNIRYANPDDGENIWDRRKDFLAETIKAFGPDLLGTQETEGHQRDDLLTRLDGYEVLAAGRNDGRESGEMMALFYRKDRFEKLAGGHFWLSETPDVPGSKGWDTSLPRMTTWIKLKDRADPESKPIAFFNTHFDHRGKLARIESARLLRKKIDELGADCRVVVTGDFNSREGSEPYQVLFRAEPASSRQIADTYRATHPESKPEEEGTTSGFRADSRSTSRIDWIGVSTDWTIKEAAIVRAQKEGRTPSDHHAITAILQPAP